MPPVNDNLANRTVLSSEDGSIVTDNIGATTETGESTQAGKTIWFQWTAPQGVDSATFDTLDSAGTDDTVLQAWVAGVGYPLPFVDTVGYNDDAGNAFYSSMEFTVTAGETYWISLGTLGGDEGTYVLKWSSEFIGQPDPVGGPAVTKMIAIGDMGAFSPSGWSAAVVSSSGGTVTLGAITEMPIMSVPPSGYSMQVRPHVARLSDTRALFVDEIYVSNFGDRALDRIDVWARIVDISSGVPVVGDAQLLWSEPVSPAFSNGARGLAGDTPNPIAGNDGYAIVASRVSTGGPTFVFDTTIYLYRIEDDLTFTEVDSYSVADYQRHWIYQLDDGTFADIYTGVGIDLVGQIVTIEPGGTLTVGSSVDLPYPTDGDPEQGFQVGIPTLVPGTRKVLLTSNLFNTAFPEIDPNGDDIGVWLVDLDTGDIGALSRFFAGGFVPRGASVTQAGRTGASGVWGLVTAPLVNDDERQRILIRPFTISGNDMVFDDTYRTVMSRLVDEVGEAEMAADFGFNYRYDGGLFIAFHEYIDYPFARMIAQPVSADAGQGYVSIFDFDGDDIDDRDHYFYTFELMSSYAASNLAGDFLFGRRTFDI